MSQIFDENDVNTFDSHETADKLPLGWLILFIGLILFGAFYFVKYTPFISGWSKEASFEESVKDIQ